MSIRNAIVAAVFITLPGLVGCRSSIGDFRTMHIAPDTLKVKLEGPLSESPIPDHDFYWRMEIQRGFLVDHFGAGQGIRYNSFFLDPDSAIHTRSKYQVLMQGPYGTVFAESTYFYAAEYQHQPIDFYAALYDNGTGHEPAERTGAIDEKGELSAISVVRVFHAPPEFLVACATYGPDGHLWILTVNGSRGGNWVHSNELVALYKDLDVATWYVDRPKTRKYFGLPMTFPVAAYLRKAQNVSQHVELSSYLDAINLHYQRNHYVQEDVFNNDGTHKTEFFQYAIPPEDRELEPVDRLMQFGR